MRVEVKFNSTICSMPSNMIKTKYDRCSYLMHSRSDWFFVVGFSSIEYLRWLSEDQKWPFEQYGESNRVARTDSKTGMYRKDQPESESRERAIPDQSQMDSTHWMWLLLSPSQILQQSHRILRKGSFTIIDERSVSCVDFQVNVINSRVSMIHYEMGMCHLKLGHVYQVKWCFGKVINTRPSVIWYYLLFSLDHRNRSWPSVLKRLKTNYLSVFPIE